MLAAAGSVDTHATPISRATPHRTAKIRRVLPTHGIHSRVRRTPPPSNVGLLLLGFRLKADVAIEPTNLGEPLMSQAALMIVEAVDHDLLLAAVGVIRRVHR